MRLFYICRHFCVLPFSALGIFLLRVKTESALCESRRRSGRNGDAGGAYKGDKEDEVLDWRRAESADGGSSPGGEESRS